VIAAGHLESNRLSQYRLERCHVPVRGPQFELRVAVRTQPREVIVAPGVEIEAGDRLGVAAIESFREPNHRGQGPHRLAQTASKIAVTLVRFLGRGLTMVPRQQRDDFDFLRIEPAKIPVLDQIIRVTVMTLVADVHADIVEQRSVLEPLAFLVRESVCASGLVEDTQRELRDLLGMLGPVPTSFAELDDAAASHVGISIDLPDSGAVAMNVVEDEPFTQCKIAQGEFVCPQPADDSVEQNHARDGEIRPSRIHGGQAQALLDICFDDPIAQPAKRFGADAAIAKLFDPAAVLVGERHRAEAEDCA
jgi:hypothetical protein